MYILQKAWKAMRETIGTFSVTHNKSNTDYCIDMALGVIDYLQKQQNRYQMVDPLVLEMEKAFLYIQKSNRIKGLEIIRQAQLTYPKSPSIGLTIFWECFIEKENAYMEGKLSSFEFITDVVACQPESFLPNTEKERTAIAFSHKTAESSIKTYPNPTSGEEVKIEFNSNLSGNSFIRLYDTRGALLTSYPVSFIKGGNKASIPIGELENGVYYLKMDLNGSSETQKMTIIR
jgi:hypothetical protein